MAYGTDYIILGLVRAEPLVNMLVPSNRISEENRETTMDQETTDGSDKCGLPMLLDEQKDHDQRPERQKINLCHPLDLDVCMV